MIRAEQLSKRFGSRRAVHAIDFELGAGECMALFGPNGAGKTTLLRLLAGLIKPSDGRALVDDVALPAPEARARIGLISHASMLYPALTALENVAFAASLYGVASTRGAAMRALERMKIADRADTPVRTLSRGMQQRVSIARAMVHDPSVVLLDEPYTGLDEIGSAALTESLVALRQRGASMVLVTHNLREGLALATHVAIMRDGAFARWEPRRAVDTDDYVDAYRALVMQNG
jgi:heme exporter protein A